MTYHQEIVCPNCGSTHIRKAGSNALGVRRYCCENPACISKSFMLVYLYKAYQPGIKGLVVGMAISSSGIRDTARGYLLAIIIAMLATTSCLVWANEPNGGYLYVPPFQVGKQFLVVQGFGGKHSHDTPLSRYAIDLAIPEGEPVCAARAGVVSDLYDGDDESVSHFVHIEHEDQTLGDYEHLQKSSITVRIGQTIKQGDCFARVGNTGNSTGAHLHFAVLHRQGVLLQVFISQPFRFRGKVDGIIPEYLTWVKNPVVK